jgi:soluble lytic murein transglycosylase-like protein
VIRAIVSAITLLSTVLAGCRPARPPADRDAEPAAPVTPAAVTPPAAEPSPRPVESPPAGQATAPKQIPREAFAHRDNFIRIWRFYFALAESPTIGFAQVHQESRWKATAKSKFAEGLAQFTPATAADYSLLLPAEVRAECPSRAGCPTSPNWALHALSLYDFNLHRRHAWAETADDRWRLALAAYNGGAGWIIKERAKANNSRRWADIVAACLRKAEFCKENREYPVVILEKWQPLYRRWLGL